MSLQLLHYMGLYFLSSSGLSLLFLFLAGFDETNGHTRRPTWQGIEGDLPPTASKKLNLANNRVSLEVDPSSIKPQTRAHPRWTPCLQACETLKQRSQLSQTLIPDHRNC